MTTKLIILLLFLGKRIYHCQNYDFKGFDKSQHIDYVYRLHEVHRQFSLWLLSLQNAASNPSLLQ